MNSAAIPPRVSHRDKQCKIVAIDFILEDVKQWLNDVSWSDEELRSALVDCYRQDGYEFAQELEGRKRWSPDAELVEILSGADITGARNKIWRDWVKAYNVTVPFQAGDLVATAKHKKATVAAIYIGTAEIVIQPEDEKEKWAGQPGCGYLIPFEDATAFLGTVGEQVPA